MAACTWAMTSSVYLGLNRRCQGDANAWKIAHDYTRHIVRWLHSHTVYNIIYWIIAAHRLDETLLIVFQCIYEINHYLTVFMTVDRQAVYYCASPTKATHCNTKLNARQVQTSCFPQPELRTSTAAILHRLINSDDRKWLNANVH